MQVIQLLLDFGLVVLIWMTQLIIYPGFNFYQEENLRVWHEKYVLRISVLVIPLMFGQLAVHGYDLILNLNLITTMRMVLVVILWVVTFGLAVPLHRKISSHRNAAVFTKKLVKMNWYRTFLWNLVFFLSFLEYLKRM